MFDYQQFHDDLAELKPYRIIARVAYIFDNLILVKVKPSRNRRQCIDAPKIESERTYHVEFIPNRVSTRVAYRALKDLKEADMTDYMKSFDLQDIEDRYGDYQDFEWFNDSIEDNEEQQTAIRNIVNCTAFPSPYVIFGGPGTGKSSTIVEAIAQIVKLKPKSHVLVCASSNSACDDIGKKLLSYVSKNKVLRIYSPSFDNKPDKLDSALQEISNFRCRNLCDCNKRSCPEAEPLDDPSYEELYTARVVICTLVSCGRIVSADVSSQHFDYIFIDEAASECEQRTLIPIAGLGVSKGKVNAQIVLCGDHKQLGAIVSNSFARKMGMEVNFYKIFFILLFKVINIFRCPSWSV
jgi:helicase MOV-10